MPSNITIEKTMKHSPRTNLAAATRFCAALSLTVWLAALLFCSSTCCVGESEGGHDEHSVASHHEDHHAPDSDQHDHHQDSFCDSLKSVVHTADKDVLTKPDFGLAFISNLPAPSQLLPLASLEAPVARQAWRRDWVFTPEVYLGPAFHSLAPPSLV